jgi:hypothetical protein
MGHRNKAHVTGNHRCLFIRTNTPTMMEYNTINADPKIGIELV